MEHFSPKKKLFDFLEAIVKNTIQVMSIAEALRENLHHRKGFFLPNHNREDIRSCLQ